MTNTQKLLNNAQELINTFQILIDEYNLEMAADNDMWREKVGRKLAKYCPELKNFRENTHWNDVCAAIDKLAQKTK